MHDEKHLQFYKGITMSLECAYNTLQTSPVQTELLKSNKFKKSYSERPKQAITDTIKSLPPSQLPITFHNWLSLSFISATINTSQHKQKFMVTFSHTNRSIKKAVLTTQMNVHIITRVVAV